MSRYYSKHIYFKINDKKHQKAWEIIKNEKSITDFIVDAVLYYQSMRDSPSKINLDDAFEAVQAAIFEYKSNINNENANIGIRAKENVIVDEEINSIAFSKQESSDSTSDASNKAQEELYNSFQNIFGIDEDE